MMFKWRWACVGGDAKTSPANTKKFKSEFRGFLWHERSALQVQETVMPVERACPQNTDHSTNSLLYLVASFAAGAGPGPCSVGAAGTDNSLFLRSWVAGDCWVTPDLWQLPLLGLSCCHWGWCLNPPSLPLVEKGWVAGLWWDEGFQ